METELPLSRIRTIMKSSLNTGQITNEVLFLMTKATEMFVQKLTEEAYAKVKDDNTLKYKHLSLYIQKEKNLEFLLQIVPAKIKVKDFKKILELEDVNSSSDSEDERRIK